MESNTNRATHGLMNLTLKDIEMTVTRIQDYNESNGSWSIEDCLNRVKEMIKEKPDRNQMIVILKNSDWDFTRFIVNMRSSEQVALLDLAKHDVLHELTGEE